MARLYSRKISCIWLQVIQTPQDPIAKEFFPIGTRKVCNKKKVPYLWKYQFLRFKTPKGECKLYVDEIEIINEKKYDIHLQKNITRRKKKKKS